MANRHEDRNRRSRKDGPGRGRFNPGAYNWGDSGRSEDWIDSQGRYGARQDWDYEGSYGTDWEEGDDQRIWDYPGIEQSAGGPFSGVGPQGYRRADERIYEDVCERLTRHGRIDPSRMQVQVENGEVTLTGQINSRVEKRLAESVADSVSGVNDVHNRLRIEGTHQYSGEEIEGDKPAFSNRYQSEKQRSNRPNSEAMSSGTSGGGRAVGSAERPHHAAEGAKKAMTGGEPDREDPR